MRLLSTLRAIALAAPFAAPLGHAALADSSQPQMGAAMAPSGNDAASAPLSVGGPYDNDSVMSPPVGD